MEVLKMFSKSKKIVFHSDKTNFDILRPFPTSKAVPNWWRKMSRVVDGVETVKTCVPFLDSLTIGYTIPLPADVFWNDEMKDFTTPAKFQLNSDHMPIQTAGVDIPDIYDPQPHKWLNSWHIRTPPGYSTLFVHPMNRMDLPFHSFSGVVDTDKHNLVINFPFVLRKDFRGIIPAGTPIIQAIPFKRDDWESEVKDSGEPYKYAKGFEVFGPPFSWYKRSSWNKKKFN